MPHNFREEKKKHLQAIYKDYPNTKISESAFLDKYLNDPNFHKRFVRGLEKLHMPDGFNSAVKKVVGLEISSGKTYLFRSARQAGMVSGSGAHVVLRFCRGQIDYRETGYAWKFEFAEILEGKMLEQHKVGIEEALRRVAGY